MTSLNVDTLPLWKKILFTLIPLLVFFIFLEIVLRFTIPFQNVRALCFHPIMARVYCPNVTGSIKYEKILTVNSDGMIDREYPVQRTPGALRVAVLGDSYTAGEEVAMGKRFHELWEQRLSRRLGREVEALNFGVRGYGTWEQLQMFHLKAAKYKPDLVVVNFLWLNDVVDNLNRLKEGAYNPLEEQYPENSLWHRVLMTRKNFNKWLWNHVITYQWFRTHYNQFEIWFKNLLRPDYDEHLGRLGEFRHQRSVQPENTRKVNGTLERDTESPLDDLFFFDSEGWQITRQLFLKLRTEVEAIGSRLAVIHFPAENQLEAYPEMPRSEFDAFLTGNGIAVLDLYPRYRALTREAVLDTTLMREHQDHHFSEQGNRVYADFTEEFLFTLLQPNTAPARTPTAR